MPDPDGLLDGCHNVFHDEKDLVEVHDRDGESVIVCIACLEDRMNGMRDEPQA